MQIKQKIFLIKDFFSCTFYLKNDFIKTLMISLQPKHFDKEFLQRYKIVIIKVVSKVHLRSLKKLG